MDSAIAESDYIAFTIGTHRDLIRMNFADCEKFVKPIWSGACSSRLELEATMTNLAPLEAAANRKRRAALERKLEELRGLVDERDALYIEHSGDAIDEATSATDCESAIRRSNDQTRWLEEVHSALARLARGSYGLCEECGEQIPAKRLDAVPWAKLCLTCQTGAESGRRQHQEMYGVAA